MSSLIKLIYLTLKEEVKKPFTYPYVEEVLTNITSTLHKSVIRNELNDHLNESIQHFQQQGFNHNDAYDLSVSAMGNPNDVSRQFNEIYNWQYPLLFISKIVAFIAVIGFTTTTLYPMFMTYNQAKGIANFPTAYSDAIDFRALDDQLEFGELILKFKGAYLMDNSTLIVQFDSSLKSPLMRYEPTVRLDSTCGSAPCFLSNQGRVIAGNTMRIFDEFIIIKDQQSIPDSISFTLINISDKQESFTLNLEDN